MYKVLASYLIVASSRYLDIAVLPSSSALARSHLAIIYHVSIMSSCASFEWLLNDQNGNCKTI